MVARLFVCLCALCWARPSVHAQDAQASDPPPTVHAHEPDAARATDKVDQEIARSLFEAGLSRASRNEWPEALELFVRSRALVDRPATALNQGLVLVRLGRLREAVSVLAQADALCTADDQELRARIGALRAEVAPLLALVEVSLSPSDATLSVDGSEPASHDGKVSLVLDPGSHRFEAHRAGYLDKRIELSLAKGEHKPLTLSLQPIALTKPAVAGALEATPSQQTPLLQTRRSEPRDARPLRKNAWLWVGVGAVVAAVTVTVLLVTVGNSGSQRPDGGASGRVFSPP